MVQNISLFNMYVNLGAVWSVPLSYQSAPASRTLKKSLISLTKAKISEEAALCPCSLSKSKTIDCDSYEEEKILTAWKIISDNPAHCYKIVSLIQ